MSEIDFLLDKARQSLEAAKLLHAENFLDIAASRVYYAMFHAAQALLFKKGLSFSSHSAVIAAFGKEFAKTGELDPMYHQYLILSQAERNLGDYAIGRHVTKEDAEKLISWGEEFLNAAVNYITAEA